MLCDSLQPGESGRGGDLRAAQSLHRQLHQLDVQHARSASCRGPARRALRRGRRRRGRRSRFLAQCLPAVVAARPCLPGPAAALRLDQVLRRLRTAQRSVSPAMWSARRRFHGHFNSSLSTVVVISCSSSYRTLAVPRTRTTLGDRSFAVAGPRVWNSSPATIRQITSYGQFRQHLRTHLLRA